MQPANFKNIRCCNDCKIISCREARGANSTYLSPQDCSGTPLTENERQLKDAEAATVLHFITINLGTSLVSFPLGSSTVLPNTLCMVRMYIGESNWEVTLIINRFLTELGGITDQTKAARLNAWAVFWFCKCQKDGKRTSLPSQETTFLAVDWVSNHWGLYWALSEGDLPTQPLSLCILTANFPCLYLLLIFMKVTQTVEYRRNNLPFACWFSGISKVVWVRNPEWVQLGRALPHSPCLPIPNKSNSQR